MGSLLPRPLVLIAELTHRCPLRCAYCSNPERLAPRSGELGTTAWGRVLSEAAELGVLQVHLTGGEPLLRDDLVAIAQLAVQAGLYPTLITSGLGRARAGAASLLVELVKAGVNAVQVSFQDTDEASARAVAGRCAWEEKQAFARLVREVGANLILNVVLHRRNLERLDTFVDLALELGADRLELAHVQYHGWARLNQAALMPTVEQVERAGRRAALAQLRHAGRIDIAHVMPDHHSGRAKPCMGGWGRRAIVVSPEGLVLPCHGASELPLDHDRVGARSLAEIWSHGPAFRAFRGEAWMEEPCRTCAERQKDFGGCRCQALALTGRMSAPDPACRHAPEHFEVVELRRRAAAPRAPADFRLRSYGHRS